MKQFGKWGSGSAKKNRYRDDSAFAFQDDRPKPQHQQRRPSFPKVTADQLFHEPVQIGKTPITHPTDPYQEYMATIYPVDITKAKFELRDENNRPLINFRGDLLYFSTSKEPFAIRAKLLERFSVQTRVVYGPANRLNPAGEEVPEPVVKK